MAVAGARFVLLVLALQTVTASPSVGDEMHDRKREEMAHTEIVKEDFHGWPNTYRLSNGLVEARVVTDVGPRIMDFHAAGGANLLYVRESEAGKGRRRRMGAARRLAAVDRAGAPRDDLRARQLAVRGRGGRVIRRCA